MTTDGGRAAQALGGLVAVASRFLGSGNPTGTRGPWCRDFVNMVLTKTGHHLRDHSRDVVTALRLGARVRQPMPGDLAVLRGHVTFFVRYDGHGGFVGLGGNQSHRVKYSDFSLPQVVAFVRPS